MSDPEDRTEPGRARRHARPPAEDDAPPPPQGGWPSRYGPRPDFTVPPDVAPDQVSTRPGEEPPPGRAGRHGRQPAPGWDAGPYQNTDPGPGNGAHPAPGGSYSPAGPGSAGPYPPAGPGSAGPYRPAGAPGPAAPYRNGDPYGNGAPNRNGDPYGNGDPSRAAGSYRGTRRRPQDPESASPQAPSAPRTPSAPQSQSAPPGPGFRPHPLTPQQPQTPQGPQYPQGPRVPQASRTPQGPPASHRPQDPSARPGSNGQPRPGFVPSGTGAYDETAAYGPPAGWAGRPGAGRGPQPDDFTGSDGFTNHRDPYVDQDGYAGRPDPYADQDGYAGRGDPYDERDGYGGRRRAEPPGAPGAPGPQAPPRPAPQHHDEAQFDFAETDDYAQHVAGPGHSAAQAGRPGGRGRRRHEPRRESQREPVPDGPGAPPWDEDGYSDADDDRFVPGLGGLGDADDYDEDDDDEPGRGGRGGRGSGRGGGGSGRRRRRWVVPLVVILIILLLPLGAGGFYAYRFVQNRYYPADFAGPGTGQAVVQIQDGQTATSVGQRLVKLGVVESLRAFELAAEHSTSRSTLEPGTYRLKKQMKATTAYALLLNPSARIQDKITIPEGWRLSQIENQLGAHSGIPLADYQAALKQPGSLGLPSYANGNPEGYLFPATYEVQPSQSATDVLKAMVSRFNDEVVGAIGAAGAPGANLDDDCAKAGLAKIQDRLK